MYQLVSQLLTVEVARSDMLKQLGIAVLGVKERFVGLLVREGQMKSRLRWSWAVISNMQGMDEPELQEKSQIVRMRSLRNLNP